MSETIEYHDGVKITIWSKWIGCENGGPAWLWRIDYNDKYEITVNLHTSREKAIEEAEKHAKLMKG